MLRRTVLICTTLALQWNSPAQAQANREGVRVQIVTRASEYVPRSTSVSQASSTVQAQAALVSDALSIGAVTLRLGMPKDAALSDLGKHYTLKRDLPSTELFDNWRIQDKTADEILGFVRFRSGKLTLASKIWTHGSKEYSGADTAGIIYKVLSKFVAEGKMNCAIQTFASQQPSGPGELEFRQAEITCGHRQIDVTLTWQSGPAYVQVDELITDEPEMPGKSDAPSSGK